MPFGQWVVGPAGSGKTTYCNGMQQFLTAIGRKAAVVNLDPANDLLPYECAVDVRELVNLEEVMSRDGLGPNGGLLYCMEYLEKNLDWLQERLAKLPEHYLIFDCPGQAELYTNHVTVRNIVESLTKSGIRLTAINLVDAYYCSVPSTYISATLMALSTMLLLELPHINILSKIDLLETYGKLPFDLEFFAEVGDLSHLTGLLKSDMIGRKYKKLNKALCSLIEDFALVSFVPLNIQDKASVHELVKKIDKSNGYIYGGLTKANDSIMTLAEGSTQWQYEQFSEVHDKYREEDDEDEDEEGWEFDEEEDEGPSTVPARQQRNEAGSVSVINPKKSAPAPLAVGQSRYLPDSGVTVRRVARKEDKDKEKDSAQPMDLESREKGQ